MKLISYLADRSISPEEFALIVGGVSVSGVRKWLYGDRIPRPDQMRRIMKVTKGKVQPNDFILEIKDEVAA